MLRLVISAGGQGSRMANLFRVSKFAKNKTLYPLQGRPSLYYLLIAARKSGIRDITILTRQQYQAGFSKSEMMHVLGRGIQLKIIATPGRQGVPNELYALTKKWKGSFIYTDGNILVKPDVLRSLAKPLPKNVFARVAVSHMDEAPTHLRVAVQKSSIKRLYSRVGVKKKLGVKINKSMQHLTSLGCMTLSPKLLSQHGLGSLPNDLDLILESQFQHLPKSIIAARVRSRWWSLHTKEDLDRIKKKEYSRLLRSLTS